MPLLTKPADREPKRNVTIRMERELIADLDAYCEFIRAGRQTVIREALAYAFQNDAEFRAWKVNRLAKGHSA
jgi:predicted transcriptional regulator